MKEHYKDSFNTRQSLREKIIGLGEKSIKKKATILNFKNGFLTWKDLKRFWIRQMILFSS